jgi:hypothetical protein
MKLAIKQASAKMSCQWAHQVEWIVIPNFSVTLQENVIFLHKTLQLMMWVK